MMANLATLSTQHSLTLTFLYMFSILDTRKMVAFGAFGDCSRRSIVTNSTFFKKRNVLLLLIFLNSREHFHLDYVFRDHDKLRWVQMSGNTYVNCNHTFLATCCTCKNFGTQDKKVCINIFLYHFTFFISKNLNIVVDIQNAYFSP